LKGKKTGKKKHYTNNFKDRLIRWLWLKQGSLKRETESLILAAQEQAIRTNAIKAYTDKSQEQSKCRMCGERDVTVNHLVS